MNDALLKYFFYYNKEVYVPTKYKSKNEHLLWLAERFIYEELPDITYSENPRKEIAHYIASYIGKWNPYNSHEILTAYLENVPSLKNEILNIYG